MTTLIADTKIILVLDSFFKLLKRKQVIMWDQGEVVVAQVVERWHSVWASQV